MWLPRRSFIAEILQSALVDTGKLEEIARDRFEVFKAKDGLSLGTHLIGKSGVIGNERNALLRGKLGVWMSRGVAIDLDGTIGLGAEPLDDHQVNVIGDLGDELLARWLAPAVCSRRSRIDPKH